MSRVKKSEGSVEQQLPALGIDPYLSLLKRSAGVAANNVETNLQSTKMGLQLLWLSDNILDVMDLDLAPYGITESKLDVLLLLVLHEGRESVTPSAIADRLGIRRASVTALLDWLEKRGWIAREQSARDRRMLHIRITTEGKALVDQVLPTFWATCASLLDDLDEQEIQLFEKVLNKLHRGIEKRAGAGR